VKALEMIKDRFYHLQKIRLSVSNRVRYAVEEMQMLDAFNDEDEWRKLYKAVSDGLQKEISENEAKIKEIRNREEEARKEAIIDELKRNMHQHLADPLSYVKDGRIFFEGYYTKELPVVGEAFRDGGVSGDSSLTKVNWTIADEDTRYQYSVIGDLGIVYVHAFVEGNIVLPGIDGGESRMQKMKLHLVRPLALEEGKNLPGQPPAGLSEQEAFKYDLGNRVFFTGMELNRQPVPKEMLNKAIRNLMFEIYDK
jgi:arsenate reductase-like glutaredoxin family protein